MDSDNAQAEVLFIQTTIAPKSSGVEMIYKEEMYDTHTGFFKILINDVWNQSIEYEHYTYDPAGELRTHGVSTVVNLKSCTSLDPWWNLGRQVSLTQCEMWLSREVFQIVETNNRAYFILDQLERGDDYGWLRLKERTCYLTFIDQTLHLLPALVLESHLGDKLVVLDDAENPLILKIKTKIFSWSLLQITKSSNNNRFLFNAYKNILEQTGSTKNLSCDRVDLF